MDSLLSVFQFSIEIEEKNNQQIIPRFKQNQNEQISAKENFNRIDTPGMEERAQLIMQLQEQIKGKGRGRPSFKQTKDWDSIMQKLNQIYEMKQYFTEEDMKTTYKQVLQEELPICNISQQRSRNLQQQMGKQKQFIVQAFLENKNWKNVFKKDEKKIENIIFNKWSKTEYSNLSLKEMKKLREVIDNLYEYPYLCYEAKQANFEFSYFSKIINMTIIQLEELEKKTKSSFMNKQMPNKEYIEKQIQPKQNKQASQQSEFDSKCKNAGENIFEETDNEEQNDKSFKPENEMQNDQSFQIDNDEQINKSFNTQNDVQLKENFKQEIVEQCDRNLQQQQDDIIEKIIENESEKSSQKYSNKSDYQIKKKYKRKKDIKFENKLLESNQKFVKIKVKKQKQTISDIKPIQNSSSILQNEQQDNQNQFIDATLQLKNSSQISNKEVDHQQNQNFIQEQEKNKEQMLVNLPKNKIIFEGCYKDESIDPIKILLLSTCLFKLSQKEQNSDLNYLKEFKSYDQCEQLNDLNCIQEFYQQYQNYDIVCQSLINETEFINQLNKLNHVEQQYTFGMGSIYSQHNLMFLQEISQNLNSCKSMLFAKLISFDQSNQEQRPNYLYLISFNQIFKGFTEILEVIQKKFRISQFELAKIYDILQKDAEIYYSNVLYILIIEENVHVQKQLDLFQTNNEQIFSDNNSKSSDRQNTIQQQEQPGQQQISSYELQQQVNHVDVDLNNMNQENTKSKSVLQQANHVDVDLNNMNQENAYSISSSNIIKDDNLEIDYKLQKIFDEKVQNSNNYEEEQQQGKELDAEIKDEALYIQSEDEEERRPNFYDFRRDLIEKYQIQPIQTLTMTQAFPSTQQIEQKYEQMKADMNEFIKEQDQWDKDHPQFTERRLKRLKYRRLQRQLEEIEWKKQYASIQKIQQYQENDQVEVPQAEEIKVEQQQILVKTTYNKNEKFKKEGKIKEKGNMQFKSSNPFNINQQQQSDSDDDITYSSNQKHHQIQFLDDVSQFGSIQNFDQKGKNSTSTQSIQQFFQMVNYLLISNSIFFQRKIIQIFIRILMNDFQYLLVQIV